jgi:predicted 2-oxoglutarate/Fe(II)-dependent dioxygenase YbiX
MKNFYKVIKGAIKPETVELIRNCLTIDKESDYYLNGVDPADVTFRGDSQSPVSYSRYGAVFNDSLMLSLQPVIEKATGKKLLPTYTYSRIYYQGSTLEPHRDRPSCEYSATLCIENDPEPWPIYMGGTKVVLEPGDLVVYEGCNIEHWREPYTGLKQVQVFLHYVDANGPYKDNKYDGRPVLGISKDEAKEKNNKSNENNDLKLNPKFVPDPVTSNIYTYDWGLELVTNENWAFLKDVFTPEECAQIIDVGTTGRSATAQRYGITGSNDKPTPDMKNLMKIRRSPISWIRSDVPENRWIFERVTQAVIEINKQFFGYDLTTIQTLQFTQYDGDEGGFYGSHIDMMYQSPTTRKLSVTIQLSKDTEYEGGDLLLHTSQDPARPAKEQGTAIFFPSWTLHEVRPVTKGTRYSLVAWCTGPRFK